MKFKGSTKVNNGGQELITEEVDRELFIDADNLNDELMDQPLLYRKYGKLKSKANRNAKAVKNKLERVIGAARMEFKRSHPKATVGELDALVAMDPTVQQCQNELLDAEELHEDMENILYTLRQRHENIKELCANIRKEMID